MATPASTLDTSFDVDRVRADFPALHQEVHGQPLVYLDNAATAQKPRAVIERVRQYYERENSNVHRGVHTLSQRATDAYEGARARIARFVGAAGPHEIVFTRGTTEAINLVADAYGRLAVGRGDEIVVTAMEHHSNIVPWQLLCQRTGARLRVVPVTDAGELVYEEYLALLNERTKLVAMVHVSNTLGTVNPVRKMVRDAHSLGIPVLVDGAQAVPHAPVDVQELGCDFYCFSSHKLFGPTGLGVLYAKAPWLDRLPPYQGGGDMIETVSFEGTTFNEPPHKFEAGTPHIAGAIGLAAAIDYLEGLGYDAIARHEHDLLAYATERLTALDGVRLIGTAPGKASVVSFLIDDIHPYDAGTILDRLGIAVRTGHHCTQPLMQRYGIPGTVRASFAFYNTREEIDRLVDGIRQVKKLFG
ncbi:MAG: cysteine desulfurase [Rhodothermaceae bacterium]|nr:MAG: cysteine desulfurase [Rhodothermaceae bacterium]